MNTINQMDYVTIDILAIDHSTNRIIGLGMGRDVSFKLEPVTANN